MLSFLKKLNYVSRDSNLLVSRWNIHNNSECVNEVMKPIASIKNRYIDYFDWIMLSFQRKLVME